MNPVYSPWQRTQDLISRLAREQNWGSQSRRVSFRLLLSLMDRIQMMDSSPLHPLLLRMLLPLKRRNELRLDSKWTHLVGLGLVPLMVEMDDFWSTLSSFYTRRWSFPIRDPRSKECVPPLELPFVGLEIARAHHLLDSFLRCSMVLVRGIGTGIRPFSAYRDWVPISFDRSVEVWIVGSFMRKDEER